MSDSGEARAPESGTPDSFSALTAPLRYLCGEVSHQPKPCGYSSMTLHSGNSNGAVRQSPRCIGAVASRASLEALRDLFTHAFAMTCLYLRASYLPIQMQNQMSRIFIFRPRIIRLLISTILAIDSQSYEPSRLHTRYKETRRAL